jgi:hypothetical protein
VSVVELSQLATYQDKLDKVLVYLTNYKSQVLYVRTVPYDTHLQTNLTDENVSFA